MHDDGMMLSPTYSESDALRDVADNAGAAIDERRGYLLANPCDLIEKMSDANIADLLVRVIDALYAREPMAAQWYEARRRIESIVDYYAERAA